MVGRQKMDEGRESIGKIFWRGFLIYEAKVAVARPVMAIECERNCQRKSLKM